MTGLINTEMNLKNFSKTEFNRDMSIEIRLMPLIKAVLGNFFIKKDINEDLHNGTDFLVLKVEQFRVAVRLRRFKYFEKYKDEFTIRWSRPSGVKTEYEKIMDGRVDYILYGFINECEDKIIHYFIGDLSVFRNMRPEPILIKKNNPPDSELAVFKINQFPLEFIKKLYQAPIKKL